MNTEMEDWLKSNDSKEYFELLRFPTVGNDPLHLTDSARCATWLKKWLKQIGAEAEIVAPPIIAGSDELTVPVVVGELKGTAATTVLVYGHYDVQPADPVESWQSPPFGPTVREGRVYCRGAQDDKGQFFAFLCGLRELYAEHPNGEKLPTIKFVLEGQEESGSGTLFRLLADPDFRRRLAADVLMVSDTSAAADLRPAIVAGLRGVNHFTVRLTAANRDLHSGEYGGVAPNAVQGLAQLIASLHNPDGSIAVAGFRDGIIPPTHDELQAAELGLPNEAEFAADIGCEPCGGQLGKSIVQRVSFEPTIEINGIHGGYGGAGSKTVIPCEAIAKISTRLVAGQDPRASYEAIRRHLEDRCPKGMRVTFPEQCGLSPALRLPLASPLFRLASSVLSEMDERGAVFQWDGASIPVIAELAAASGAAPLLVGWGQSEDRIHSPNESYSLLQFKKAREWAKRILSSFGII